MMSLQNIKKIQHPILEGEHKLGNLISIIFKPQSRNMAAVVVVVVLVLVEVTLLFTAPTVKKMSDVVAVKPRTQEPGY